MSQAPNSYPSPREGHVFIEIPENEAMLEIDPRDEHAWEVYMAILGAERFLNVRPGENTMESIATEAFRIADAFHRVQDARSRQVFADELTK